MVSDIESALPAFSPPGRGERVLAAVSGGADSVALLLLLARSREERGIELVCAHYNHGIRGEAAREDARFVSELCARLSVPCELGEGDVPQMARDRRVGLERAARDARYAFLRGVKRARGADVIALAHHMDDQAETVLMHELRGCATRGLVGMREREDDLYRPLLGARKAELVAFLRALGEGWREDATNAVPDNARNALRLDIMPRLEAIYPGCARALVRLSRAAAADEDFIAPFVDGFLCDCARERPYGWRVRLREGTARAVLSRAFLRLAGPDAELIGEICGLCARAGGTVNLPGGGRAEKIGDEIYLTTRARAVLQPIAIPDEGEISVRGLGRLKIGRCEPIPIRDAPRRQALSARALAGACLRTRAPGDVIRPLGAGGAMKLSDYLINRKVPRPERDFTPLVARGGEVLWVIGQGISERAALAGECEARSLEFIPE